MSGLRLSFLFLCLSAFSLSACSDPDEDRRRTPNGDTGGGDVGEELDAPELDAPEPDAPEPDAPEPDVEEPDAPEPDVEEPDAPETDVEEPDAPGPDVEEPDTPGEDAWSDADYSHVPTEWTCQPSYYGSEDGCDCGCGVADPDCPNNEVESCEYCYHCGSGEGDDCNRFLNPESPWLCLEPDPDLCGNGELDPGELCDPNAPSEYPCWDHPSGNYVSGYLSCTSDCSFDTSECIEAPEIPEGWTCEEWRVGDDVCDCGCGVLDPDCPEMPTIESCESCACSEGELDSCLSLVNTRNLGECANLSGFCGDGVIQPEDGEQCDGENFGGNICANYGNYNDGFLMCTSECEVDLSQCLWISEP